MPSPHERISVLYLAPWVDIGGSDTATVDWFRFVDRDRFQANLITTQPSPNRRLHEVTPYAEELWELPQLMSGAEFPDLILAFIHTRQIQLVHIMNSQLGFDLLPDIACLPNRPRVVVQLHGEEPNGQGYVSHVTTRYGNLVDAYSLTTGLLSRSLDAYDVPARKRRVIPIGVDAEREFSPENVRPIEGLDTTAFRILFPARLTAQKDPLLMVEVAEQLRACGLRFQVHVLGDGDLTEAVRKRVATAGLQGEVLVHGARVDIAPWYAACEAVLLTSEFETSPSRAAYEAMAMGLPIIAPALRELQELVVPGTGVLVRPCRDARAYASAICALAADRPGRKAIGEAGRARVRSEFSLERMAGEHRSLYEELLADPPHAGHAHEARPSQPAAITAPLCGRRPGTKPLVSVIVTCFNQGRYLDGCLLSVRRQTYQPIETIVVDDGSTDQETMVALASVERGGAATVLRLPTNRGPSAARNAGIEHAHGRYVLPLDGDDMLVESAIADLVAQLGGAEERIGFIYPNIQFFGNRSDYVEMLSYNLHSLLEANHCPVSSLIDREVFDRGYRYPEEITLGHEDWDFVLTLAEYGIYGERAQTKTLLCRSRAFTRSELVEVGMSFGEIVAARHPRLFANRAEIKGEWDPSLSLIALDQRYEAADLKAELMTVATNQTCPDFELIVGTSQELRPSALGGRVQRVPTEPTASRASALARCLQMSRGRYALAVYGSLARLLADRSLIEKTLRILRANPNVVALALADSGFEQLPFRLLNSHDASGAALGALCWSTSGPAAPPASLVLAGHRPLEALACWLGLDRTVQWRHFPWRDGAQLSEHGDGAQAALGAPQHPGAGYARLHRAPPALPECPPGVARRVRSSGVWRPPQTRLLCRHRDDESGCHVYTNSTAPPEGHELDHVLGCIREYPLQGTKSLQLLGDERAFAFGASSDLHDPSLLGFVEQKPLPLLDPLLSGRHAGTGERVLVAGHEDPLTNTISEETVVGYVEPYPIRPRLSAHVDVTYGLIGLVRTVDVEARRHRYGAGHVPLGLEGGELGALFAEPMRESDLLWIDENGRVLATAEASHNGRPSVRAAVRWTADPLTWRDFSLMGPKARATARRALDSVRILVSSPLANGHRFEPVGYLLRSPTSRTVPLLAALHPVTGDQLLSTDASEAASLGYGEAALLGHLIARAPVTGKLGPIRPAAPWAARFGLVALAHE